MDTGRVVRELFLWPVRDGGGWRSTERESMIDILELKW